MENPSTSAASKPHNMKCLKVKDVSAFPISYLVQNPPRQRVKSTTATMLMAASACVRSKYVTSDDCFINVRRIAYYHKLQDVADLHGNWYVTPYVQTMTAMQEHAALAAENTYTHTPASKHSRIICQY